MKKAKRSEHRSTPLDGPLTIHVPLTFRRRGGRTTMMNSAIHRPTALQPEPANAATIRALAKAFRWRRMLETGQFATLKEIAAAERVNESYLSRVIRLTLLAPDIVEALLDGRDDHLDLRRLLALLPTFWSEQKAALLEH